MFLGPSITNLYTGDKIELNFFLNLQEVHQKNLKSLCLYLQFHLLPQVATVIMHPHKTFLIHDDTLWHRVYVIIVHKQKNKPSLHSSSCNSCSDPGLVGARLPRQLSCLLNAQQLLSSIWGRIWGLTMDLFQERK